ncbi:hypothetical protein FOMPIDRAFT_1056253 [Fomitopsis schrenkii]|uniref:Uncharacterized protein n=1 Tax=Fomitopsis schrenkii TaxID=2126942 RepID=S8ETQ5_FOMSC|nr:hypothetical protein FOMPIDRAFT_1056253 [Fomitopsis schrenkii]
MYEPTLTIRLFSPDAGMWLQLTLETATDFWLLVQCLGMATEIPTPENGEDYEAFLEDMEYLLDVATQFEDHMEAGISSIAERKGSERLVMVNAIFLAFISGILICDFIGLS